MASPTVPTVALPTPTLDDTDDDDDDDVSSLLPAPVATTPPAQPPPAQTLPPAPVPPPAATSAAGQPPASAPGVPASTLIPNASPASRVPSGSPTRLADTLPSGSSSPTSSANSSSNGGGGGLSTGAAAGVGVGVALAVILMAIGAWFYIRTRRRKRQHRKTSKSSYNGDSPDEEVAQRSAGPEVRAYYAGGGVPELPNGKEVGDPRRLSELASPVVPQEVHGDREFAAELPGSAVPAAAVAKSGEGWSSPPPIYEQVPPRQEKKSGVRLFDDEPIDEVSSPVDVDERPRVMDKKGAL
ncbi:hypothetical protein FB567DRAFT_518610 [Paraphoma chrysanthemicola]|uniref:Uncharacterized protein n=1 Tax=Paraphoma chrysanthemicola TaxID=798071 RepID=A0A8K0RAG7_9PLEO|nr:hypothetical protein FB567DRAFT_518610 [Paraphoma chrysanthemicola]